MASQPSTVKICVDRPLEVRVLGATAANAQVRTVELVVCSSFGDIVSVFPIDQEHLIVAADATTDSIDMHIKGSKQQYGLPKNTRSAIAAAKRQVPRYAADKMTVRLRVCLVVRHASGIADLTVLADGDLEIATNRHRRHAEVAFKQEAPEPVCQKRRREEVPGEAEQLRQELAEEKRAMEAMKAQLAEAQALAQERAQEIAQLRQQCGFA